LGDWERQLKPSCRARPSADDQKPMTNHERILAFFEGRGTDQSHRRIAEVLAFGDDSIENVHDFIRWLFPTPEHSDANPGAPVLEDETIAAFGQDEKLRATLLQGFEMMLEFYGLELLTEGAGLEVREGTDFMEKSETWLIPGDHNHLRISRILLSLRVLSCEEHSLAFLRFLETLCARLPHRFKGKTLPLWRAQATGMRGGASRRVDV